MKECLKIANPNHSFFAISKERLKIWRDSNIKGNKYNEEQCKEILQVMENFFLLPGLPKETIEEVIQNKIRRF